MASTAHRPSTISYRWHNLIFKQPTPIMSYSITSSLIRSILPKTGIIATLNTAVLSTDNKQAPMNHGIYQESWKCCGLIVYVSNALNRRFKPHSDACPQLLHTRGERRTTNRHGPGFDINIKWNKQHFFSKDNDVLFSTIFCPSLFFLPMVTELFHVHLYHIPNYLGKEIKTKCQIQKVF